MTTYKLPVRECIKFGWNKFKERPWFFVGTFIIYMLVQILLSMVQKGMPGLLSFVISTVVSTFLYLGLISIYLKAHDDVQAPRYADYWHPASFWKYLGASILLGIIVIIGTILLIVPGVIAAIAFSFTGYLIVDKQLNPIAALKESARLTKGNRYKFFLLALAFFGLAILGAIPLFLGLLVVAPVSMLAGVHAYRLLEREHGELPVVATPAA